MSNFINKVLKISQQYSYLKPVIGKDDVLSYYKYGPLGELLCHHLTNEWTLSSVITRDIPVFPFHSLPNSDNLIEAIKDEYLEAKNICQNTLPFCITFSRIPKTRPFNKNSSSASENKYFRPLNTIELKSITFTTPNDDRQFFYFWQRQRKIWWRKFAAKPGRFSLSEIKTSENMECTEIQAKFEWGSESVETIRWLKGDIFQNISNEDKKLCEILVKRKRIFPSVIESTSHLDTMAFCYLCDAFTEEIRLDTELPRQFIKLHRKLTPYRTAFAVELKEKSHQEDLKLLAEYFALNLKKAGFPVLFVPQLCYKSPNEVFEYYDLLGIPYVIVLKSSTLTDGIFGLRSRETTIQELLHMNQLVEYFEMLFKNY